MSETARLPAHLEVAMLLRRTQAEGGFGVVLHRGERDAGTILIVARENGDQQRLIERMPCPDGLRPWTETRVASPGGDPAFEDYLNRRIRGDPDVWVIELDVADLQRLVPILG